MRLNNIVRILLGFLYSVLLFSPLDAQFLTVEIDVKPEVNATVEQALNFGQITTNAGEVQFGLGDPAMGIFSVRAVRTQRMLITVDMPDVLTHEELNASIPVNLQLAIANTGVDNWRLADHIDNYPAEIEILAPADQPGSEWSLAYIYVYGMLNVGNIPTGVYTSDIYLNVEYD